MLRKMTESVTVAVPSSLFRLSKGSSEKLMLMYGVFKISEQQLLIASSEGLHLREEPQLDAT